MVHAAHGKSNVLSPAAKFFVTWDREAVYNFVLHERRADVVEHLYKIPKKMGSMGLPLHNVIEQTPHLLALRNR